MRPRLNHNPHTKALREHAPRPSATTPAPAEKRQSSPLDEHAVLCRFCGHHITGQDAAIAVADNHQHVFFNPAGIAFTIRCFRSAPGVMSQGSSSTEFTWFSSYAWQVVLCAACQTHLGWRFLSQSTGDQFFGLIATHLTES